MQRPITDMSRMWRALFCPAKLVPGELLGGYWTNANITKPIFRFCKKPLRRQCQYSAPPSSQQLMAALTFPFLHQTSTWFYTCDQLRYICSSCPSIEILLYYLRHDLQLDDASQRRIQHSLRVPRGPAAFPSALTNQSPHLHAQYDCAWRAWSLESPAACRKNVGRSRLIRHAEAYCTKYTCGR